MPNITKTYTVGFPHDYFRKKDEAKFLANGYGVFSEEFFKERSWGDTCCLAIIFLPLALFFGNIKKVRVTYSKLDNKI